MIVDKRRDIINSVVINDEHVISRGVPSHLRDAELLGHFICTLTCVLAMRSILFQMPETQLDRNIGISRVESPVLTSRHRHMLWVEM